jgi:hypothetical protein
VTTTALAAATSNLPAAVLMLSCKAETILWGSLLMHENCRPATAHIRKCRQLQ